MMFIMFMVYTKIWLKILSLWYLLNITKIWLKYNVYDVCYVYGLDKYIWLKIYCTKNIYL
jgi:hypothetical protein